MHTHAGSLETKGTRNRTASDVSRKCTSSERAFAKSQGPTRWKRGGWWRRGWRRRSACTCINTGGAEVFVVLHTDSGWIQLHGWIHE